MPPAGMSMLGRGASIRIGRYQSPPSVPTGSAGPGSRMIDGSRIKPGDVIVRIDGAVVDSPNKLSRLIATHTPGATSKIEVVRDLKHITLDVPLTERRETAVIASIPQQEEKGGVRLGLDVQDLTAALAERFKLRESKGVLIVKVEPNSLAQAEGLREGDLIKEVNRREVFSVGEFISAMARARRGDTLLLRVLRENRAFYVVLKSSD